MKLFFFLPPGRLSFAIILLLLCCMHACTHTYCQRMHLNMRAQAHNTHFLLVLDESNREYPQQDVVWLSGRKTRTSHESILQTSVNPSGRSLFPLYPKLIENNLFPNISQIILSGEDNEAGNWMMSWFHSYNSLFLFVVVSTSLPLFFFCLQKRCGACTPGQ